MLVRLNKELLRASTERYVSGYSMPLEAIWPNLNMAIELVAKSVGRNQF